MTPSPRRTSRTKSLIGVVALAALMLVFSVKSVLTGPAGGPEVLLARIGPMVLVALAAAIIAQSFGVILPRRLQRLGYTRFVAEGYGYTLDAVTFFAGLAAVDAAGEGRWLTVLLRLSVPVIIFGVGVLVYRALARRSPPQVSRGFRCPECDYHFGFEGESEAPERCSECGTDWRGRLVPVIAKRPAVFWPTLGLSLALLVMVGIVLPAIPIASRMPTGTLAWWAGIRTNNADAWMTLATRPMSQPQIDDLAERLLERRLRRHWALGADAHRWLEAQIAAGTLSPELRERYFAEMVVLQLELPSRVRAGESFVAGVTGKRIEGGFGYRPIVYGRGLAFGDAWFDASTPGHGTSPSVFRPHGALPCVHTEVVLETPGTLPVRVEAWVVCGAPLVAGFPPRVTWNADGTPALPPGTAWSQRVVLEGSVVVLPP